MITSGATSQGESNPLGGAPPQIVKKPATTGAVLKAEPGIGGDKGMPEALTAINLEFKEKTIKDRAKELNLEYVEIGKTPINPDLLKIIDFETAQSAMVIPFLRIGKDLRIAVTDPEKAETKKLLEDLKTKEFVLHISLTSEEQFKEALKLYEFHKKFIEKEIVTHVAEERQAYEKELAVLADLKEKVEKVTSEEALNIIEVGAMKTRASDIHYEPGEKQTRVRFRIDGVLHVIFTISNPIYANMANQLKYRCGMKLNITNIPQDGRYSFVINERKVDVRVSAIPTEFGESFVCRLLDSGKHFENFEELGFEGDYLERMKRLTTLSYGMILVCGPTGSGKTTTLYSLLTKYNKPEAKIITLEDPIEYHLDGVTQSQINAKRGYDFGDVLRSILRQDPDVVMIGEIRDLDTASTAAQAALTGHVLLSTLHTNSA
ncbi:Flp pilus assembly complex ATPase component TadA, partial [Candidatus Peregrinibacteria bacterium]|nr:Flp pilus assembly complex ATPase component TadA [Candidatus Peregrinibacteria bacterium]